MIGLIYEDNLNDQEKNIKRTQIQYIISKRMQIPLIKKDANPIYKLFIIMEFVQTIYDIELTQRFVDVFLSSTAR